MYPDNGRFEGHVPGTVHVVDGVRVDKEQEMSDESLRTKLAEILEINPEDVDNWVLWHTEELSALATCDSVRAATLQPLQADLFDDLQRAADSLRKYHHLFMASYAPHGV